MRSPIDCWISMNAVTPRHGNGLRRVSPTRTQDCRRRFLLAGWRSDNKRMIEAGCESLKWLVAEQHRGDADIFVPIGSRGVFRRRRREGAFRSATGRGLRNNLRVFAAYRLTNEKRWLEEAWCAFRWFLGENDLQVPLYDATTGGCRDGLHPDRVNENQGAESTLSFLMALLEMQSVEMANVETTESGNECLHLNPIHPSGGIAGVHCD